MQGRYHTPQAVCALRRGDPCREGPCDARAPDGEHDRAANRLALRRLGNRPDARGDTVDDAMSLGHDRLAGDPGGTRDRALLHGTVGVILGRGQAG